MTILGILPNEEIRTGGHRRYAELLRQLGELGHRTVTVCRPRMVDVIPGTTIPLIPDTLSGWLVPRWWRYRRILQRNRTRIRAAVSDERATPPAVVLIFGESNAPAAMILADLFAVPLVFGMRNNMVDELARIGTFAQRIRGFTAAQRQFQSWWKRRLERWICAASTRVVFQTDYDRDDVVTRNPQLAPRARIVPNSFRVSWLTEFHRVRGDLPRLPRNLIYLGHLNERKGIRYLLQAVILLRERGVRSFQLDVVGFGDLEARVHESVVHHGLERVVRLHGRDDSPLRRVAAADLMIVPSLYDAFPNTVLEALCVGTPVIGSRTAGIRSMLQEPELLFDSADADALADRLQQILTQPAAYQRVAQLCNPRRAAFDFDWGKHWEAILDEVVYGSRRHE